MNLDRAIFAFAGAMVLGSLALAHFHSPNWLYLTAFVGLNLFQSAITRWCLMETIMRKVGFGAGN